MSNLFSPEKIPLLLKGNAPDSELWCIDCPLGTAVHCTLVGQKYPWCIQIICDKCSVRWFSCRVCCNYRSRCRIFDLRRRGRHHKSYHSDCGGFPDADAVEDDKNSSPSFLVYDSEPVDNMTNHSRSSSTFFDRLSVVGPKAVTDIVAKAHFGNDLYADRLRFADVLDQLVMTGFIFGLTRNQREEFARVADTIVRNTEERVSRLSSQDVSCTTFEICAVPATMPLLRSIYMDGRSSIYNGLPRPSVTMLGGHTYMPLKEIVAHHLAFATIEEVSVFDDFFRDNSREGLMPNSLYNSVAGYERIQEAQTCNNFLRTIPVLAALWSDGFEPSTSSKDNRGSGWILTITFCRPVGVNRRSTYVIALGEAKLDHNIVFEQFAKDLKDLQQGDVFFFHGGLSKSVRCHVEILSVLQDQPERRSSTCIGMGNATYSMRWGYSAHTEEIFDKLKACSACYEALLSGTTCECSTCACWDYSKPVLESSIPKNFPLDCEVLQMDASGKPCLRPFSYSFEQLQSACELSLKKLTDETWNVKTVKQHLTVHCLNDKIISGVMESWKNDEPFHVPASWHLVSCFSSFPDVPMHLLGLGIGKTVNKDLIRKWLKKKKLFSSFSKGADSKMKAVQQLRLSWCKAMPFGMLGNCGGWVSENQFAWIRLSRWLYANLQDLKEDAPYVEPRKAISKWTLQECINWLKARGLKAKTKQKVSDVRSTILQYKCGVEEVPEVIPPLGGSIDSVNAVLISLTAFVSHCLGFSECKDFLPSLVDRLIKVFLSTVETFEVSFRTPEESSCVASHWNFLCLLNIPSIMRRYGMLRLLWEGGQMGEGIIRHIKPLINNGLRRGWSISAHKRFATYMSLEQVLHYYKSSTASGQYPDWNADADADDEEDECDEDEGELDGDSYAVSDAAQFYGNYKRYQSLSLIIASFYSGLPVSAVIMGTNIYVVVRDGYMYQVIVSEEDVINRLALLYFHVELDENPLEIDLGNADQMEFALLLPLHFNSPNDVPYFSCITKQYWELFNHDDRFGIGLGLLNIEN